MLPLDEFRDRYRAFVAHLARADPDQREGLVRSAVADGLPPVDGPVPPVDDRQQLLADLAIIRAGADFDELTYMWHNPDVAWNLCEHQEGLIHFAGTGWRELRHPHPGFDLWFYWNRYLDPTRDDVNPVVHHLLEGRRHGASTLPELRHQPAPTRPGTDAPPRRICLFAGFDVDGVVDQTVLDYVADLSRFADVYYLADCVMEEGELDKLAPHVRGAWAIRHGRYDFGSYSMLAGELVGWDVIDGYDEMILANDSCWLVQPFDRVFAKMDATACHWWGLQATHEAFTVRDHERRGAPLALDEVQDEMRRLDLWRYSDFIHVGSYFVVYRRPVLQDPEFRRRLDTVAPQRDKAAIILKYEIGFSRLLVLEGYDLATFVDGILPFHPIYRASAFDLLADGFPLLKRQLLHENPFSAPDLRQWKKRVLEHVPTADVEPMERNLRRVAPVWSLHRSFALNTNARGEVESSLPLEADAFPGEDDWVPTFDHWWAFPVDPRTGLLSGGVRAVFEAVADDPSIRKFVLTGDQPAPSGGTNVVHVAAESLPGQIYALRLGTVFTHVGPRSDLNHPLNPHYHRFVQLGWATGLEGPGLLDGRGPARWWQQRDPAAVAEDGPSTGVVVVASDAVADVAPGKFEHLWDGGLWRTGSPRASLLLGRERRLGRALRTELARLRSLVEGRRLVVVEPWHEPYDIAALAGWAADHPDVALGVRRPLHDESPLPAPLLDLAAVVPETAWRLASVLVSGSDADLADWAVLARPAVRLGRDHDLPLPTTPAHEVLHALEAALGTDADPDFVAWGRDLHTWSDADSAARVALEVQRTYLPIDEWLQEG